MVCLDDDGAVVRPALLWNDLRSGKAAAQLVAELGAQAWVDAVGTVPVASFTVTKLRWLAEHEPRERVPYRCGVPAARLPQLAPRRIAWPASDSFTDRGDASGTGYWSPRTGEYRLRPARAGARQAGRSCPPCSARRRRAGRPRRARSSGPGTGDNAAAALGLGAGPGDVVVSIGTSGVVSAVSEVPAGDVTGAVAGFADATGRFLPLVCTHQRRAHPRRRPPGCSASTSTSCPAGAAGARPAPDGLVLVPYLEGERTPDKPYATGSLHGLTLTR